MEETEEFPYVYRFREPPGLRGKRLRLIRRSVKAIYVKGSSGLPVLNLEDGSCRVPVEFEDGMKIDVSRSSFVRAGMRAGVKVIRKIRRGDTSLQEIRRKKHGWRA